MAILSAGERLLSRTLGDEYPYWWRDMDGAIHTSKFFDEAMGELPQSPRTLDPVSILSILSMRYIALDRSLVQGVNRLSWLSEVDAEGVLRFEQAPPHEHQCAPANVVAKKLRDLLEQEILGYCRGKSKIYVLLSGGMDSRVMAGVLASLQRKNEIHVPIVAMSWGIEQSRDCRYAEKLANYLGWEWRWAELDAESYWRQFDLCADLGAEVDPKNLHRMDWFRNVEPDAVALAASYGDSVGRAEYSSVHLTKLNPLMPSDKNRLLKDSVRKLAWPKLVADLKAIRGRYGNRSELGWYEIERQSHYMRRMLCTTMGVINRWCELRQVFTQQNTFGLMWSLDVACRTGEPYASILRDLDPKLLDIPWARTGARYDTGEGSDETYSKRYHRYGYWLRTHHADKLGELIHSPKLAELDIFDLDQVHFMYDEWRRERPADDTTLSTHLSTIAVTVLAAQRFGISAPAHVRSPGSVLLSAQSLVERQAARASQVARRLTRPARVRRRA